jgi:formamidopyrimidine-DNA glycosylase
MKPEEMDAWPPKYWKFHMVTEDPAVEVAFTDPRRFGRVRLVDCPGESIRQYSPLVENGPDPVVDTDVFTEEYLREKMRSRHVPIKALILDQTVISGVGNWVGDEVLYQAKLHPEQYCDDFSDEQIKQLYESIRHVCQFAVDKLGDSDQFPKSWLFHYRWDKGKKGAHGHLPSGERLAFLTVGGRTSCYVPDVQKKSGRIVAGVKEELLESDQEDSKPKKAAKSKTIKAECDSPQNKKKRKAEEEEQPLKKSKAAPKTASTTRGAKAAKVEETVAVDTEVDSGRRRSGRLQKKTA